MNSNCGGIVGLNTPDESYLTRENMDGVWFENQEASFQHQGQMTRVEPKYSDLCATPLRSGRLDPPEIVLFYANPAQTILFVNGLQWRRYKRYDMTIIGESACSDSWGRALTSAPPPTRVVWPLLLPLRTIYEAVIIKTVFLSTRVASLMDPGSSLPTTCTK